MRLIELDAAKEMFSDVLAYMGEEVKYKLGCCPRIEPDSLVKRGRWEEIRNAYGELEGWLCECGREVKSKDRFCPSCGALMED